MFFRVRKRERAIKIIQLSKEVNKGRGKFIVNISVHKRGLINIYTVIKSKNIQFLKIITCVRIIFKISNISYCMFL